MSDLERTDKVVSLGGLRYSVDVIILNNIFIALMYLKIMTLFPWIYITSSPGTHHTLRLEYHIMCMFAFLISIKWTASKRHLRRNKLQK